MCVCACVFVVCVDICVCACVCVVCVCVCVCRYVFMRVSLGGSAGVSRAADNFVTVKGHR